MWRGKTTKSGFIRSRRWQRQIRIGTFLLSTECTIENRIIRYICGKQWSPEQIVGYCRLKGYAMVSIERNVNYSIITKLPNGKNANDVLKAAVRELTPYIDTIKSITTDNGCEFAKHQELAKALKTTVFFAHPYASWEKGAIENANKLYRQYIPKGASFADYTEQEIKQIQYILNDRPRKNQLSITKTNFFPNFAKNPLHLEVESAF